MFESRVNPPQRREFPQVMLATAVAVVAAVLICGALARHDAGEEASPRAWPIAGFLIAAAAAIYEWHLLWRAWHPPLTLDPAGLPSPFDWDDVWRRMNDYYGTDEAATASPEETDGVYPLRSTTQSPSTTSTSSVSCSTATRAQ